MLGRVRIPLGELVGGILHHAVDVERDHGLLRLGVQGGVVGLGSERKAKG